MRDYDPESPDSIADLRQVEQVARGMVAAANKPAKLRPDAVVKALGLEQRRSGPRTERETEAATAPASTIDDAAFDSVATFPGNRYGIDAAIAMWRTLGEAAALVRLLRSPRTSSTARRRYLRRARRLLNLGGITADATKCEEIIAAYKARAEQERGRVSADRDGRAASGRPPATPAQLDTLRRDIERNVDQHRQERDQQLAALVRPRATDAHVERALHIRWMRMRFALANLAQTVLAVDERADAKRRAGKLAKAVGFTGRLAPEGWHEQCRVIYLLDLASTQERAVRGKRRLGERALGKRALFGKSVSADKARERVRAVREWECRSKKSAS